MTQLELDQAALLQAIQEAIDIPHGASMGDEETRSRILIDRAQSAAIALQLLADATGASPAWLAMHLREQLASHPVIGYRTWEEAAAELKHRCPAPEGGDGS